MEKTHLLLETLTHHVGQGRNENGVTRMPDASLAPVILACLGG
jgi:hypothetical protein